MLDFIVYEYEKSKKIKTFYFIFYCKIIMYILKRVNLMDYSYDDIKALNERILEQ